MEPIIIIMIKDELSPPHFFFALIFEIFKIIDSWPSTWSISENKPWVLVKNAHSLVVALK